MNDTPNDDPFLQGQQAAKADKAVTDNPHPPATEEHDQWKEGHASSGPPEDISEELGKFA